MFQVNVKIADFENRPECVHQAFMDSENEWNGWACPYFEKAEVERMNAWLPKEYGEKLVYDKEHDIFNCVGPDDSIVESFYGIDINGIRLYPIGSGSWLWAAEMDPAEVSSPIERAAHCDLSQRELIGPSLSPQSHAR